MSGCNENPSGGMTRPFTDLQEAFLTINRTIGVLHIVGKLLPATYIPPCGVFEKNSRFLCHPLPCSRHLWEARSSRIWRINFRKHLLERQTTSMLIVGDVLNGDKAGDNKLKADIVRWCENLDTMGTLIYMALPLGQ